MAVDIDNDIIDLKTLVKVIKENKKKFIILQIAVVALISLFIVTTPKEYRANAEIAPEISTDQNNNVVNILKLISQINFTPKEIDAIYPLMYPNVVNSDNFTTKLFNTKISTIDGKINTTYYDYLKNHTKTPLWKKPFVFVSNIFRKKEYNVSVADSLGKHTSVVKLTREQEKITKKIQDNVICVVDRKMGIISIFVTDQDPLVCTLMTDTIAERLKQFIIEYRTNKARIDYTFCHNVYTEAKTNYEKAQATLVAWAKNHIDIDRTDLKLTKTKLEQDVSNKRLIMEAAEIQMYSAKAKIQDCTPVFSIIQKPFVPQHPIFPKVLLTMILSLLVANFMMLGYIFRKRLIKLID